MLTDAISCDDGASLGLIGARRSPSLMLESLLIPNVGRTVEIYADNQCRVIRISWDLPEQPTVLRS